MNITDDEALGFMDRLPEWLRQADLTNFGSHIEVVYVSPGAQHVDKQYIASPPSPLQKARGVDSSEMSKSLPDELATDEAMILWRKVLADAMAERLDIKEKWKVFEALWHRRNMHKDFYLAFGQQQTSDFQDELKELFG